MFWFWCALTVGSLSTAIFLYISYGKNRKLKKSNAKLIIAICCSIISAISLAIVANYIYDFIFIKDTANSSDNIIQNDIYNGGNNNTYQQGNDVINNINQQGDGENNVYINPNTISTSVDKERWQIERINDINHRIEIGNDLVLEFAIYTPPSQFSTPYYLYGGYYLNNNWSQFCNIDIPSGRTHIKITIDTYSLMLEPGDYNFSFDLFRAEDYSEGNSCAAYFDTFQLIGKNINYDGASGKNKIQWTKFNYFVIKDQKYFMDTESLTLSDVSENDVKIIGYLDDLKHLSINGPDITSIEPLKNLKKLKTLSIHSNNLNDLSPLKEMTNLTSLSIGGENRYGLGTHGTLKDISPIKDLTNLKSLSIYDCSVENIECIGNIKLLENVDIHKTKVRDISPLSQLYFVKNIELYSNKIEDISSLYNLSSLNYINLSYNYLTNEQINDLRNHLPNCDIYPQEIS